MNAAYTFLRQRHYRLFESPVDDAPSTPSAQRVRVNSSPVASSPLRLLSNLLAGDNAEARSHPDMTRDVWEIALWDPTPLCLRMFCLLSPGHVVVYWLFLPTVISDPRPSITVLTTVLLAGLLSGQLLLLCSKFSQQSKDASIIHKEVMNEYDTKFVHPRTQPLMRDVGTQYFSRELSRGGRPQYEGDMDSVETYKPMFIINKGFKTRPNPNYVKHVDPEGLTWQTTPGRRISASIPPAFQSPAHLEDTSASLRPQTAIRQPQFRATSTGDGGSLGIYSHANSPLRKSTSANFGEPLVWRERNKSPSKRESSPLKQSSLAPTSNGYRSIGSTTLQPRRESGKF